jgi:hypothetical protein
MNRPFIALALLLTAATALAQSTVIERIDVATTRVKPGIIRSETRLRAGRAYTTGQIDQALYRVRRLPFIVDATYSLDPGSAPDRRVLTIHVIEEQRFHYTFDAQGVAQRGGYATSTAGLGLHFFPGSNGILDANMGGVGSSGGGGAGNGHFGDVSVQYTGYGLFGSSAFAGIGVTTRYNGGGERLTSPLALVGIPLTQTQTVRGTYQRSGLKSDNNSVMTVEWLLDTTDDPYFARRGVSLAAGPQWQKFHFAATFNSPPHVLVVDDNLKSSGFVAAAEKFWPVATHSALWARANGSALTDSPTSNGVKGPDTHRQLGDVLIGVAQNFDAWRGTEGDGFHRLRVELGVGYHRDRQKHTFSTEDRSGGELFVNIAHRSRYGVFRLGVSFVSSH